MSIQAGIGAGAEADGFTLGGMIAAFGSLSDQVASVRDALNQPPGLPVRRPKPFGTAKTDGSSPFVIPLQSDLQPSVGFIWNIRAAAVLGVADAHTIIAGSYEIYSGMLPNTGGSTQPVAAHVIDLVAVSSTIPAASPGIFTYTGEVFWTRPTETIYALVYGVAANTQLALVTCVDEWRLCDVERLIA